jgi:hypothetical protein
MSVNDSEAKAIYLFRCNDSALYALTADSSGHILPSKIYPRINWRLERRVTLRCNHNSDNDKVITATLKAIVDCGFYLTNAGSLLFSLADQNPVGVGHLNGRGWPFETIATTTVFRGWAWLAGVAKFEPIRAGSLWEVS